jgi:tripartite ATP-independent transporter DctM subunit
MEPTTIFSGMVLLLLLAFFAGIPIYASFLICNIVGLFLLIGSNGLGLFVNSIINTATMNSLVTIPFFILMGDILYRANAVDALVTSADTLIGRLRGRHYILSIAVSTILATLSGSAMASSAMLCRTVYPAMISRGYDRKMSLGVILGGACLAPIIPPSVMAIIIATVASVSISDLFVAGFVPGLLISAMFLVYIIVRVRLNPALAPDDAEYRRPDMADLGRAVLQLMPFTLVILLVIGSIMFGIATPTESAAIGPRR